MALSGSATTNFARHSLIIEWSATQSIASNNSTVTARVYLRSNDGYGAMQAPASNAGSVTVNGVTKSFTANSNLSANQKKLLTTQIFTVGHNGDGTKSFNFSTTYNVNVTFAGTYYGNRTASGSGTLNTIPRKSTMSHNRGSGMNFGDTVRFTISKASSGFTSTLKYNINGEVVIVNKTSATTYDWTPAVSLCSRIPNSTSVNATIWIDTYNGNTRIGSNSYTLTLRVPSSVSPNVTGLAHSEQDSTVKGLALASSEYVQSKSKVRLTASWSMMHGATVTSVTWGVGSAHTTGTSAPTINLASNNGISGNQTVFCEVKDSRGRTTRASATISILTYANPRISSFSVNRTTGTNIKVDRTVSFNSLGGKNTLTYSLTRAGAASGSVGDISGTATTYTFSGYDVTKSYDFTLTVSDKFTSVTSVDNISTARTLFDMNKDIGIGIGKMNEGKGALELDGGIYLNGEMFIEGTGRIVSAENSFASNGKAALDLKNSDMVGLNGLYFGGTNGSGSGMSDPADNDGEGLIFPRTGTVIPSSGTINRSSGWDTLRVVDGKGALNGTIVFNENTGSRLWSGAWFMTSGHRITLPSINNFPNGWILQWSRYASGAVQQDTWSYTVVHKDHANYNGGMAHVVAYSSTNPSSLCIKYIYVNNSTELAGHASNDTSGGNNVVLRAVFGF